MSKKCIPPTVLEEIVQLHTSKKDHTQFKNHKEYFDYLMGYDWYLNLILERANLVKDYSYFCDDISDTDILIEYIQEMKENSPGDEEGYDVSEYSGGSKDVDCSCRDDCDAYDFTDNRDFEGQNKESDYSGWGEEDWD